MYICILLFLSKIGMHTVKEDLACKKGNKRGGGGKVRGKKGEGGREGRIEKEKRKE